MAPTRPSDNSLVPCPECGFGVSPTLEFCPDCGLSQRPVQRSLLRRLFTKSQKPPRAEQCLRKQEARIEAEQKRLRAEMLRLSQKRQELEARQQEARNAGRSDAALSTSLQTVALALAQRQTLKLRYQAAHHDLQLDRKENTLKLLWQKTADLPEEKAEHLARSPSPPRCLFTMPGERSEIGSVAFHPEGTTLAFSCDHTAKLWRPGSPTAHATLPGHPRPVRRVIFHPEGDLLACASGDTVTLWDAASLAPRGVLTGESGHLWDIAFHPQGRLLAAASVYAVTLWDVEAKSLLATLRGHSQPVRALAFHPEGKLLASASRDGTIKLWDLSAFHALLQPTAGSAQLPGTPEPKATLDAHDEIVSLAFHPQGKLLVSGGFHAQIKLWDIETRKIAGALQGHKDHITALSFHPEGKLLASASRDGTIKLWDVETGTERHTLSGHSGEVLSLAFHPQSSTLASGASDGALKLWQYERQKLSGDLSEVSDALVEFVENLSSFCERLACDEALLSTREGAESLARARNLLEEAVAFWQHLFSRRARLILSRSAAEDPDIWRALARSLLDEITFLPPPSPSRPRQPRLKRRSPGFRQSFPYKTSYRRPKRSSRRSLRSLTLWNRPAKPPARRGPTFSSSRRKRPEGCSPLSRASPGRAGFIPAPSPWKRRSRKSSLTSPPGSTRSSPGRRWRPSEASLPSKKSSSSQNFKSSGSL